MITRVETDNCGLNVGYGDSILMLGSCFSDNVGERLSRCLMDVCVNPFGTLYNPASIARAVERLAENRLFTESELFEHSGMWHSFFHHSRFSSASREKALNGINAAYSDAVGRLRSGSVMIVTFGTAYVFRHGGSVVANCHKLPQREFERSRMDVDGIVEEWEMTLALLSRVNPGLKVVFTVSPIRHRADGMHGNQLSKAVLLLAVDKLVAGHPQCCYFPSYEIVLDELRDYRFFAADMAHPTETAVDYVFERFSETYFTEATRKRTVACLKLYRMVSHRPLTDNLAEIGKFRQATVDYARRLAEELPCVKGQIEKLLREKGM